MFSSVVGQEFAVAVLKNALAADHLAATYLFVGPTHCGKTTTAFEFAKALNCERRPISGGNSCDQCRSCRAIDARAHPDVRSAAPSGPSRTLRMAQFWPRDGVKEHPADRALLRDLHFAPVQGKRRVFIVEEADALNDDTANSLLKVLEEPPPYALFLLTAPGGETILPTIVSRSQAVRFRLAPQTAIQEELRVRTSVTREEAQFLAAYAQGRMGTALSLAASKTALEGRNALLAVAGQLTGGPPAIRAFKLADELRKAATKIGPDKDDEEKGQRSALTQALDVLMLWYGDLLALSIAGSKARIANPDREEVLRRHVARWNSREIVRALQLLRDTRGYVERNANAQIALEVLILNLLSLEGKECK